MRGDSRCPRFCVTCKADCRCNTPSCNICHTCRDKSHFNCSYSCSHYANGYGTMSFTTIIPGCNAFDHDCSKYIPEHQSSVMTNMLVFPKLFSSDIIEITVGKSEKELRHVPREVLAKHSEYFKNTFSFNEKAGKDSTKTPIILEMDVDRPHAFDKFIQFMYWDDYVTPATLKHDDLDFRVHAEVYILSERLQAPKLKDLALRKATKVAIEFNTRVLDTSKKAEAIVHLTCVPDIIDMIYLNTLDVSDEEPITPADLVKAVMAEGPVKQKPVDKFRQLIAAFSKACLDELKDTEGFLECLKVFPDFAVDLVKMLPRGPSLVMDDKGYLKM